MVTRNLMSLGIAIALINYILFAFLWIMLGGSAINGVSAEGHYFISASGHLVEVTRSIFELSVWLSYGLFITFPIGLGCAWYWSHRLA